MEPKKSFDINILKNTDTSTSKINWMEKLKPSTKNKLIQQKFKNFQIAQEDFEDSKWGIEAIPLNITEDNINQSMITQKLSCQLKQIKKDETNIDFFLNQSNVLNNNDAVSEMSEFEDINNDIGNNN